VAAVEKIKESASSPIFSGTATGHNGADSKFIGSVSVLSTENPATMRGHAVRKAEYFVVLSVSSFQKFWKRFLD